MKNFFKWIATPHDFLSKPKKNILHHQKNAFQKYAHFFFKTRVSVVNLFIFTKTKQHGVLQNRPLITCVQSDAF